MGFVSNIKRWLWHVSRYEVDSRNDDAFRSNSKRIEEWRAGDFASAADGMLKAVFKDTDGLQPRYAALIQRIAKDGAAQYNRPPRRIFSGLNKTAREALLAVYRDSRIDSGVRVGQQKSEPQNSVIISIEPTADRGRLRLMSWVPGEVLRVERTNPLSTDMLDVERIELEAPYEADPDGRGVRIGKRVYTKTEAWEEFGDVQRPIFGDSIDHDFGRIPLIVVRLEEPIRGQFFPALRLDYLAAQEALCVAMSDMEHIARTQSAGERVLMGPGALQALNQLHGASQDAEMASILSATAIKAFDGDGLTYQVINPKPDLKQYGETITRIVEVVTRYAYANPEGLLGSTGVTGAAKEAEKQDLREEQQRKERIWREAEDDLLELVVMVSNATPGALKIPVGVTVSVDHLYVKPIPNDLQASQAREIDHARGYSSMVEDVSRDEGISIAEAEVKVEARVKEYRKLRVAGGNITPQGLDRIGELGEQVDGEEAGPPVAATEEEAAVVAAVQDPAESLNGAQVTALIETVAKVGTGELTQDQAAAALVFSYGMSEEMARRMAKGPPPKPDPVAPPAPD